MYPLFGVNSPECEGLVSALGTEKKNRERKKQRIEGEKRRRDNRKPMSSKQPEFRDRESSNM